ncbi:MAG: DUF4160 domain-containing protein [Nitrococcus mobilis]|nr:DUF4160 domain-containing protein [Nitrococcus mobilis]
MHVHVHCGHGEAKYWLEPEIDLARNYGLSDKDLSVVRRLIEEHQHEIRRVWQEHYGG